MLLINIYLQDVPFYIFETCLILSVHLQSSFFLVYSVQGKVVQYLLLLSIGNRSGIRRNRAFDVYWVVEDRERERSRQTETSIDRQTEEGRETESTRPAARAHVCTPGSYAQRKC